MVSGIKRIFKASYCSYLGLKAAFKEESAFRQELLLACLMLPISFFLAESANTLGNIVNSVFYF